MSTVAIGKRYLSLAEASDYTSLSVMTLRRAIQDNRLRALRPDGTRSIRVDVLDLGRFMAGQARPESA